MKKFIVFFLICSFLFASSLYKTKFDFSKYEDLTVQVFTSNKVQNKFDDVTYVDNGEGQILICDYANYQVLCKTLNEISGVTFVIGGDDGILSDIIKELAVKIYEQDKYSFVGYTNYFDKCVKVDGKMINVQGYFCDNKIYIGTPLLLGSY